MPARSTRRGIPSALFLFLFWLILSGSLHPLHLALGLILSLLLGRVAERTFGGDAPSITVRKMGLLLLYLAHLVHLITVAAFHVARRVLDPRLPIAPVTVIHRTSLTLPVARVALANSLTLTPGTLTVDLDGPELRIHCLEPEFADQVKGLEARIARVFEEAPR
jgi:multicomponent Na+:H+ antiporter subunit E